MNLNDFAHAFDADPEINRLHKLLVAVERELDAMAGAETKKNTVSFGSFRVQVVVLAPEKLSVIKVLERQQARLQNMIDARAAEIRGSMVERPKEMQ